MCAIPSSWKSKIREFGKRFPVVKSQNTERLYKKVTSFTYDILRKSVPIQPTKVQHKWDKHLLSPVEDRSTYYRIPFLWTSASKLRSFRYGIFHRTFGIYVLFMKMGINSHDECFSCDNKPETIEHLFWCCDRIFPLWSALANWIWLVTEPDIEVSLESVLLGSTNCMPCRNSINCIILVVKFFIYNCKMELQYEKFACHFSHQDKVLSKWKPIKYYFVNK